MIARKLWDVTVERIQGSRALQILAAICFVDYLGFLWLSVSERISWSSSLVLFVFSISCWFWAVTWPPFWNALTRELQSPNARNTVLFVERFGLVALFFVQSVYSALLIIYVTMRTTG